MSNVDIVRAWKDEEYRHSLSVEQQQELPANPAGLIELSDEDMSSVSGGCTTCGNPLHTPVIACKPVFGEFGELSL
ncbi:mersacidin/lichenicidin family type 2 lantibiotic [Cronbergia sp. UHCC 0137]|uniref:mersacidin/lichenicidin family type 2 lantibiotic n=1 Tax=Cronbergia sp. UHCC 0137 TaxID=3110239 RepID=UPI002B21105A|nr:mersacidin/lichenicidin family type 2 lantibiotic [Cronbergia sp. UHCC 0137]MEA5617253.1 mersacidin/lichenicidin family type 2 lantibiotic [Cronbergia sp. UHCC 0137]